MTPSTPPRSSRVRFVALAGAVLVAFALTALSPSLPASAADVVVPLASTSGHPDAAEVTSTRVVQTQVRTAAHHTPPTPERAQAQVPPPPSRPALPVDPIASYDVRADPTVPRAPPRHD